jgi:hypothetical protein
MKATSKSEATRRRVRRRHGSDTGSAGRGRRDRYTVERWGRVPPDTKSASGVMGARTMGASANKDAVIGEGTARNSLCGKRFRRISQPRLR